MSTFDVFGCSLVLCFVFVACLLFLVCVGVFVWCCSRVMKDIVKQCLRGLLFSVVFWFVWLFVCYVNSVGSLLKYLYCVLLLSFVYV